MFNHTEPHVWVAKNCSVWSFTLSRQKKWIGVRRLHLPESQRWTGDCGESGLDSGQQRHPFWNCCQIPAWFQCIIISKKDLFNLLYKHRFLCLLKKTIQMGLFFFFLHNSMFYFQAKVNNASLVGIGYTQTLRPGKEDPSLITLITTDGTFNPSLFQYLICLIVFCARNESNPLCTCGWEEYQCRWPQTWSWIGIGGMRRTFCLFRVQQE